MTHIDDMPFMTEKTAMDVPEFGEKISTPGAAQGAVRPSGAQAAPLPIRLPRTRILPVAEKLLEKLTPLCDRIEIAGSLRRGLEYVGDIDLVIETADRRPVMALIQQGCRLLTNGEQNVIAQWNLTPTEPWQLDIFFAKPPSHNLFEPEPGNFATLFLCRTGSKQFNIWFASQCLARGRQWNPYKGVEINGVIRPAQTEADLFEQAGVPYEPPEKRER